MPAGRGLAADPTFGYTHAVDALHAHDLEQARQLTPGEKLEQALEVMRAGIRLKRSTLRRQHPHADDAELDRRLEEWLAHDG